MSLINKMLQDLDARGTPAGDAFPSNVKPVASEKRAPSLRLVGAAVGGALAAVALGWFAWTQLHAPRAVAVKPGRSLGGTIAAAPAAATGPIVRVAPTAAVTPRMIVPETVELAPEKTEEERESEPARGHAVHAPEAVDGRDTGKSVAPMEPDGVEAREARKAAALELATRGSRLARVARLSPRRTSTVAKRETETGHGATSKTGIKTKPETEGRNESPAQRAENEYRRALADLQDGRMVDTISALQRALRIDPGHDAARQTLVGLLVEAGRSDDAIRELQAGLAQDPRQPALAMLLARLQIERGGSGIDTLQRTLPYAGNDGEYHAFLAGALQRQQRQREAAEQYQQALRASPGNGVWWMGLGISLQADKRNAEALDAFQKARASAGLSPELQSFVERRIQQLGR